MKHKILTTCFALVCSVAMLNAQSTPSNTGSQPDRDRNTTQTDTNKPDHSRSTAKGSITLTGCLQAGTEPNTFMLNNVSESAAASKSSSSNSQTSSAPSEMARADSSYMLIPNNKNMNLSQHIGKRVEVTGTIMPDKGDNKSHGSMGSTSSDQSSRHSDMSSMSEHHLKVRSIRQVASTCP